MGLTAMQPIFMGTMEAVHVHFTELDGGYCVAVKS
jgi:hypothetical protein